MDGVGPRSGDFRIWIVATSRRKPRHTVRIVNRRAIPRPAIISLTLAFGVAVGLFLVWRLWRPDKPIDMIVRNQGEVVYKCERNHTFWAAVQPETRECPVCGQPAYARVIYACEIHGTFDVALRFGKDPADGKVKAMEFRLPGRGWVARGVTLRCPRCNRELERQPVDPLAGRRVDVEVDVEDGDGDGG